jgi:hypothetical protein
VVTKEAPALPPRSVVFEPLAGLPKPGVVRFVEVPARRCFAVDGEGAPGGEAFQDAFAVLYPAAYTLHFAMKKAGREAKVGTLEGLWERLDGNAFTAVPDLPDDPEAWRWTLLIEIPAEATEAEVDAAIAAARARRPGPAAEKLRCARSDAEPSVETMHVGPYGEEAPTIAAMLGAVAAAGLRTAGPHHEIYLGDPRRAAPEKLRTVLRQRVAAAG